MMTLYLREFQTYPEGFEWLQQVPDGDIVEEENDESLYCFICGLRITSATRRTEAAGSHIHTFTNPGGFTFTIGCFREAKGCRETGSYSEQFTWFPNTAWCYLQCSSCGIHLGWSYRHRGERHFFGLILKRLVSWRDKLKFSRG